MNYEECLAYIHSVKWRGSKPGLSRTRELLKRLGNPEKKLKFVHIAGTNGKGSAAASIAAILRASGYKTGLYTSPYVLRFNERMQIDGEQIPDDELCALTEKIRPFADSMEDVPTEFEMITAIGMEFFAAHSCDVVVLEVGLGGELDSTNVIDTPEAAVIMTIGLDHTRELGSTIPEIASAKAGIIKPGGDVIIYGGKNGEEEVFERVCREKNARLHKTDFSKLDIKSLSLKGAEFDFGDIKDIFLPMAGTYQPYNAAVAITAAGVLADKGWSITGESIKKGLAALYWPGRFEVLAEAPTFIIDGAHNPNGAEAAAKSLREYFPEGGIVFLMGVMADKDLSGMLPHYGPMAKRFVAVTAPNPRAMKAEELAERLASTGVPAEARDTIEEGVKAAVEAAGKKGVVCALGTLYFSADVRESVGNCVKNGLLLP